MIELHLIGYTADLEYLVLDEDPERDRGRYRLVIDGDLFATLEEIRAGRLAAGMDVGDAYRVEGVADGEPAAGPEDLAGVEPLAREPVAREPEEPEVIEPPPRRPDARLSPAQIQNLLRRGRSVRSIAKEAGTDHEWIERWLPPIEAERRRILEAAWSRRLERPRLGRSRENLREAVERSLRDRKVAEEDVVWEAARRRNGTWSVAVRYRYRGKTRSATWIYDPVEGDVDAASDLARDLAFTRPRKRAGR